MGNGAKGGPHIFRILAGGYVIYLAYQILSSVAKGDVKEDPTLLVIAAIAFIILGGGLLIYTIRDMKRLKEEEAELIEETEEESAEDVVEALEETEEESAEDVVEATEEVTEKVEEETADE